MFDTMTIVKVGGGVLSAFLFFLLGNWAASALYSIEPGHGAHGEEHVAGYHIELEDTGEEEEVVEVSFEELMATADASKGEKVWGKCRACHKLEDGANGTGPYLYGVVGRDIGSVGDFGYSDVMTSLEGNWTPEALFEFLANPKAYAPGTKMTFAGLNKETDRVNLIAYLETIGG